MDDKARIRVWALGAAALLMVVALAAKASPAQAAARRPAPWDFSPGVVAVQADKTLVPGYGAFRDLLRAMHHGGSVALLGIPPAEVAIDWNQVIFKGLVIKGIYGREMFETWYKMAAMLQSGLDVGAIVTHRLPAHRYEEAFATVSTGECGKVILDWI